MIEPPEHLKEAFERAKQWPSDEHIAGRWRDLCDRMGWRVCPTACDDDCTSHCHELHQPPYKREHFCCPDCRMTSVNPDDVKNEYCGNCHKFKNGESRG